MKTVATGVPAAVERAHALVTPALRTALLSLCTGVRTVAGYHQGWLDAQGRPARATGGKALRPALALLSAQAAGVLAEQGVPAACAVEMVHGFSLLHDDIIDGDTHRRHRPTAWTVFGTSSAILAGDALMNAAMELLLGQDDVGAKAAALRLANDCQRMIAGQASDLEFERHHDVTLDECLGMIGDKTGALLSCASAIGAELVGGEKEVVQGLARFGEHLGIAFQLVDDLLGIWGSPERTGKPVLSDLRSRKKSVPVVVALAASTPVSEQLADLYSRADPLDEDELRLAAELVEQAGGRGWAEQEASRRLVAAEACLTALELPSPVKDDFLEIARFVTDRNH